MRSPAIAPGFGLIARPSLGHGLGWQVEAVQIVIHSGVRGGFGHQQEISAALDECLTQRLPGVEVVTEVHGGAGVGSGSDCGLAIVWRHSSHNPALRRHLEV